MPTEVLIKLGTPIVWADITDYSPTVSGLARTHQLDLTSVAAAEARQGAKADLGAVRADRFIVLAALEFAIAPGSGELVDLYWASSPHAAAGNANPGGTDGTDSDYTGTAGDSLDDSLKQLEFIGSLIATSDATTVVQYQEIGILTPTMRHGMPVIDNNTAQALVADAVEMYIALIPIIDELQ